MIFITSTYDQKKKLVTSIINKLIPLVINTCGTYYFHEPNIQEFSVILEFEVCRYSENLRMYLVDMFDGVSVSISETGHAYYKLTINKFD